MEEDPKNRPDGILFRKGQTEIKSATDKILHKGIYPEEKIFAALEKALAFLGDGRIEGLYRICLFHYLLEYIHPFYDGNGRLGRFVVSESKKIFKNITKPLTRVTIHETGAT